MPAESTPNGAHYYRRRCSRTRIYELALLATLVTALTLAAGWTYPTWDDGRLMLAIEQFGGDTIWHTFSNRPLSAGFFTFLFNHQLFLPIGMVLHWTAWMGMGVVTMRVWREMFPALTQFALLPAMLSVAPILCKVQLVLLTIPTIALIGPVLCYVGIFLLTSEQSSTWRRIILVAAGTSLVVFSVLLSEYGVATAAVGCILLCVRAIYGEAGRRRERFFNAALLSVGALLSYMVFLRVTKDANWSGFRPGYVLETFSVRIPVRWLTGIWRGAIGGILESLGTVSLNGKVGLLSFLFGVAFSGLVVLRRFKREALEFSLKQNKISLIILILSVPVALIPFVLMDRTLESKWDSRFWIPVLPVLSSLSVYILFYILKARLNLLVPILCGFLAGYWTTFEITNAIRNPEPYARLEKFTYQDVDATSRFGNNRKLGVVE